MLTTATAIRQAFWAAHPNLPCERITDYSGTGLMYPTDTRVAWNNWVDAMSQDGLIERDLAHTVTLSEDDE